MKSLKSVSLVFLFLFAPLTLQAEIRVKVIQGPADLPEPFCELAQKGDFLIADGSYEFLVGGTARWLKNIINYPDANAMGSILSLVPAGKHLRDRVNIGSPIIRLRGRENVLSYSSVQQRKNSSAAAGAVLECAASFEGPGREKLLVKTTYEFLPGQGRINIRSTLTNSGTSAVKDLSFSLSVNANSRYYFSPFHKELHPGLNFRACQKEGHALGLLNSNAIPTDEEHPLPGTLGPRQSYQIQYVLWTNGETGTVLQKIYDYLHLKTMPATLRFKDFSGKLMEVVVREEVSSSIFFKAFLEQSQDLRVPLPDGVYSVTANLFPAIATASLAVKEKGKNSCLIQSPPLGGVRVKVQDRKGVFVPGKVTFVGLAPTKNPYFAPDNPVRTGRGWVGFKNTCYAQEEGIEVSLAAGAYSMCCSRGPEYTTQQRVIEVLKDKSQELIFQIDRILPRSGFISFDPHLHTQNSDGAVGITERLRSIVAEGVDVASATDHNFITDYLPDLKKNGLDKYLAVMAGSEVTPASNFIHFCVYPEKIRPGEENHGAVVPLKEDAATLFRDNRRANPEAVLQLNHPREGDLGYFNNLHLDEKTAASADRGFDLSIDVFEAMNGAIFGGSNQKAIEDWFHLLCRGYFFPIVGSSDAHWTDGNEPGYSRTYVFLGPTKEKEVDLAALLAAVKKGKSFISNGPMVEFKVNKRYTAGDFLTARRGKIVLWLKVQSAPWVSVSKARIILNGERKMTLPITGQEKDPVKLEKRVEFVLDKDTFIAIEVLGTKTLYPVVQQRSYEGQPDTAAFPYALTNPVFVDVDGNGRFDPPWHEKVKENQK